MTNDNTNNHRITARLDLEDERQALCDKLLFNAGYKKNLLLGIMALELIEKYDIDVSDRASVMNFIKSYEYLRSALSYSNSSLAAGRIIAPPLSHNEPLSTPHARKDASVSHSPESDTSASSDESIDIEAADDVLNAFGI